MQAHPKAIPGFQAVIFDCDGTLVDSEPLGIAALLEEASLLGLRMDPEEALVALKGKRMSTCVEIMEARFGCALPADFVGKARRRMADAFRSHLQEIPGARDLLSALAVPYCIASNGPREKIALTLELAGLAPLLRGPIFSAYDVGHWKPAPGLFLHAARAMGAQAHRCAVVEDSEPGIAAGLAAGMTVFALRQAHERPAGHTREGVVHIDGLADLARHLFSPPREMAG